MKSLKYCCKTCPHKGECLDKKGSPNQKNIQRKANRLGGIWVPSGCPMNPLEKVGSYVYVRDEDAWNVS